MQLYLVQCSGPLAPHCYKSSNTVFEIINYIQCSAWDLWPLAFLNPVHLYSFMIPNQFQCCAQDLWHLPDCFHGHLLGNYTNIQVFFSFLLAILYILDTVLGTFSPSQFLLNHFLRLLLQHCTWKLYYKHTCCYFLFSFFSVVLGPLPLQSILYLLRVYFFRCGVSGPSASCIFLK